MGIFATPLPAPADERVVVTDDPGAIEQWRQRVARESGAEAEWILAERRAAFQVQPHEWGTLELAKEDLVGRLAGSADREPLVPEGLAGLWVLRRLAPEKWEPRAARALEAKSPAVRRAALTQIIDDIEAAPIGADSRLTGLILGLLDDPDPEIRAEAARASRFLDPSQAAPALARQLGQRPGENASKLGYYLGEFGLSLDHVDLVANLLDAAAPEEIGDLPLALYQFTLGQDGRIQERAAARLRNWIDRTQAAARQNDDLGNRREYAQRLLLSRPVGLILPWIQKVADTSTDTVLRRRALLAAGVAGKGAAGPWLVAKLADDAEQAFVVRALGVAYQGTADPEVTRKLLALEPTNAERRLGLAEALARIGAPAGLERARVLVADGPLIHRYWIEWFGAGRTLDLVKETVVDAGLLTESEYDSAARSATRVGRPIDEAETTLTDVLQHALILYSFYTDRSNRSMRHEPLVWGAGKRSKGLFRPIDVWQTRTEAGGALLGFIANGRLYQVELEPTPDRLDIDRVLAAVHRALADGGERGRFVFSPAAESPLTTYIFGTPAALARLAAELSLPVDPAELESLNTPGSEQTTIAPR